ncbi:hypothetical protein LOTGIDRAFT_128587 [Lottia gigantea]|uniref:Signal transducer and activator of transcription n=1 Tax=Lottia gigantea TaxID=225164 RepID=V3ZVZ7_LOTGI|nr:hypothetical protein LOTGIDRAFT_128587 [Lottia gigantea]ESO86785.1 hypothetical protein LOTGIDRAFT_128587 [Lottia gigantea]
MSKWARIQQSQVIFDRIQPLYIHGLPIEVRHFFAEWIESQPWWVAEIQIEDPTHLAYASQLLAQLIAMIEEKAATESSELYVRLKLREIANQLKVVYERNPMGFVQVVRNCLETEDQLLQEAESVSLISDLLVFQTGGIKIFIYSSCLTMKPLQSIESKVQVKKQQQESFIIRYQDNVKIQGVEAQIQQNQLNHNQELQDKKLDLLQKKEKIETYLRDKAELLLNYRIELADLLVDLMTTLADLQNRVLGDLLTDWLRKQKLAGNGAPFDNNLSNIQTWCESLADIAWRNRQQIKKIDLLRRQLPISLPEGQEDQLPLLMKTATDLIYNLVAHTFIVDNQPAQVMKKDGKFSTSIKLLVGGKLNVHMNPPEVKAVIISESQAREIMKNGAQVDIKPCGEILNNRGTMEYHQATGQLGISFKNMQLKKIKRADKKGSDCVTEEKFCIYFSSEFSLGGNELSCKVSRMSLPVVVTVHGNQDPNAWATILWDNAFSDVNREPFHVPESVPWPKLAEQLNAKFVHDNGRGLTPNNLQYLASKIFNEGINEDFSNRLVSWSQFNKDHLPGRNFTFWIWFYDMLKLTNLHLVRQWREGHIIGFISKAQAQENLLQSQVNGTFLLRFSDSESGGLTIAWVSQRPEVYNLAPFRACDFKIRKLSDRIKDLNNLVNLYPNIPKDQAFGGDYSPAVRKLKILC